MGYDSSWVEVQWDNGGIALYRYGSMGIHEVVRPNHRDWAAAGMEQLQLECGLIISNNTSSLSFGKNSSTFPPVSFLPLIVGEEVVRGKAFHIYLPLSLY